ncbi:MAG: hypothetical protein QG585_168 [Patescibacteria group bacterium]|jgi:NRAMP (natural resistance-associated macrophage protein)-like metal ion transporter|nr:hypothetical protein [Patescibacteria group bacterium]
MENLETKPSNTLKSLSSSFLKKGKFYWKRMGPGIVTGAADDDPSGIATYSQAGAQHGFKYLWLSLYTFPLVAVIQEMCARIAIATGRGLAGNISLYFPKWMLYSVAGFLFVANTFNIGADLGAMAEAMTLLVPSIPSWVYLFSIALICISFEIYSSYAVYAKYLKWLTFALLAYIVAGLLTKFNLNELFRASIIPTVTFTKESFFIITAILGTTISPYLFFWQTSQEVEEEILNGQDANRSDLEKKLTVSAMRYDVWFGMFFSNLVMFFIIAVCADNLFKNGITDINSAAQAAEALKPIAGNFASFFFALGIIGTGFLAIPVLAGSSAYALAESFKWKEGLYLKFKEGRAFYFVIIFSVLLGLLQNFIGLHPFKALLYSAVLNGLVAPLVLVFIVILASRKDVMGELKNGKWSTLIGIFTTILMFIVAGFTIFGMVS